MTGPKLPWCHPTVLARKRGAVVKSAEAGRLGDLSAIPTTERREAAIRRLAERVR